MLMLMLISQRNGRLYAAVGHTTPKKHFQSFWFARLSIQPRLKSPQASTTNQSHNHGREVEANGKKNSHQIWQRKDCRPQCTSGDYNHHKCIITTNKAVLVESAMNIIKMRQQILSDQTKDMLKLTQEASSVWATMYYGKQRIMHNYGQLSRGRGGGNKWSCRELATQQRAAHYTGQRGAQYAESKEEHCGYLSIKHKEEEEEEGGS